MKKLSKNIEHQAWARRPPREVRLHALIFGGTASAATPPGAPLPMVTDSHEAKYPNAAGE